MIHYCLPGRTVFLLLFICLSLQAFSQMADFTVSTKRACAPFAVSFKDRSSGGQISKLEWYLGTQLIARDNSEVGQLFKTQGNYAITLKVTFSDGQIKTKTDTIFVYPTPVASFEISDTAGCAPHNVTLSDRSTTETGTIEKRFWNVGNIPGTEKEAAFTLRDNGDYNVKLYVVNNFGCASSTKEAANAIHVYDAVTANFEIPTKFSCDTMLDVQFVNHYHGRRQYQLPLELW